MNPLAQEGYDAPMAGGHARRPPENGVTSVPEAPVAGLVEPRVAATPEWEAWDDQRLLDTRLCDLGLRLRGSFVDPFLRQVRLELRQKGLLVRPHF